MGAGAVPTDSSAHGSALPTRRAGGQEWTKQGRILPAFLFWRMGIIPRLEWGRSHG